MPLEHIEDWRLAAENRRRRRLGLPEIENPHWPTDEFQDLQMALFELGLQHPKAVTQNAVRESAAMFIEESPTLGVQTRMMERMTVLLAEARAQLLRLEGTREPGEEG